MLSPNPDTGEPSTSSGELRAPSAAVAHLGSAQRNLLGVASQILHRTHLRIIRLEKWHGVAFVRPQRGRQANCLIPNSRRRDTKGESAFSRDRSLTSGSKRRACHSSQCFPASFAPTIAKRLLIRLLI